MILFIGVPWIEGLKSLRWLNISARYARDITNSSFLKCSAMPLPRWLRNCSISLNSSNTNKHTTTVQCGKDHCVYPKLRYQKHFNGQRFKAWPLIKFTVLTTIDNKFFNFQGVYAWVAFSRRVSQNKFGVPCPPVLVLRTTKGYVYPPVKNHCTIIFRGKFR